MYTEEPLSAQILLVLSEIDQRAKGARGKSWANSLMRACAKGWKAGECPIEFPQEISRMLSSPSFCAGGWCPIQQPGELLVNSSVMTCATSVCPIECPEGVPTDYAVAYCAAYLFAAEVLEDANKFMGLVENVTRLIDETDVTPEHIEATLNLMGEHGPDDLPDFQQYWVIDSHSGLAECDVGGMLRETPFGDLCADSLIKVAELLPSWSEDVRVELDRRELNV